MAVEDLEEPQKGEKPQEKGHGEGLFPVAEGGAPQGQAQAQGDSLLGGAEPEELDLRGLHLHR
jgi:hypothetical protein